MMDTIQLSCYGGRAFLVAGTKSIKVHVENTWIWEQNVFRDEKAIIS